MIPGHHRSAADRPAAPPPVAPRTAGGLGIAILVSILLCGLGIVAALHLVARLTP